MKKILRVITTMVVEVEIDDRITAKHDDVNDLFMLAANRYANNNEDVIEQYLNNMALSLGINSTNHEPIIDFGLVNVDTESIIL